MKILFLDDQSVRHNAFCPNHHPYSERTTAHVCVIKNIVCYHVYTAEQAIEALTHERFDLISLDHDLGQLPSGEEVAKFLASQKAEGLFEKTQPEIVIHSWNPVGAARMETILAEAGYQKIRRTPFRV